MPAYLPIPVGVSKSETVKKFVMGGCDGNIRRDFSATASINVPKSVIAREYVPISEHRATVKDTSGNWQRIKESGFIKMTPMSNIHERTERFLGSITHDVHNQSLVHDSRQTSRVNGVCVNCTVKVRVRAHASVSGWYVEQGDISYWRWRFPNAPFIQPTNGGIDDAAVEAMKSAAYAELFQGYNLGEELYELRETLATILSLLHRGALLLLRQREAFNRAMDAADLKGAANAWMEFRYGIMPILFSIQDIQELLEDEGNYLTVRKKVVAEPYSFPERPSGTHFYQEVDDSTSVSITTKGRWVSSLSKQLDRINVNLLTTAAAVYPWSMVVRWFFNINSWIDAQIKSGTSTAIQHAGCVAYRTKKTTRTFLHFEGDSTSIIYDNGDSGPCGIGYYGPYGPFTLGGKYSQDVLLQTESINNYVRTLYSPKDTKLVWNPYLTWQRIVDGLILSSNAVSKLLRSFK